MDSWKNTVMPRMSDTPQPVVLLKTPPYGAACGHDNPPDAVFCGECGASRQTEPPCPTCGRTNPAGLKFCRGCGARLLVSLTSSTPTLPLPAIRTTLASGRYQIQRILGEGAKKRVYLARDTQLDREVALALFKTESLDEPGRTRIRREAQALSQLGDHPHIVTLYDVNEEDGQPYFLSQYLAGGSLQELLQRAEHHRLPLARAFTLADEICQALQPAVPRLHALDRLVSDVFVGRERESDTLRDDLEEALAGRGRAVVLTGEPGIGKTRLATELTVYARLRGARLLIGRCHEDEGAPPYWPWVQMLRAYAAERSSEQLRAEMGAGGADIAQIIPDLREHFPALPAPPPLDSAQARFRFFDSFTTFLKTAAKHHPLVVLLDDLQWADPSSLLLLQFVAREISETRLLMILTCREGEPTQHSFLARTLATIARTVSGKTLPLRSLTAADVARFIELTTGQTPSSGLVTTVYQETESHPFFMTEIVRLLATEEASSALSTQHFLGYPRACAP